MEVSWATSAGHPERAGHVNEDFVGAVTDAVVLLDGAGIPGAGHLCSHGVEWYTRRLGGALLSRLPAHGRDLTAVLADAIGEVADLHWDTCAIADTSSPQAAVAVVRLAGSRLDVLVLGDCHVVVAREGRDPVLVTDGREAAVRAECLAALSGMPRGTAAFDRAMDGVRAAFRARRNAAGGFWVAKDDPAAAQEAVLAEESLEGVTGVGLLSNGASRVVDPYGVAGWADVVRMLADEGPADLVRAVREAEDEAAQHGDDAAAQHGDDEAAQHGGELEAPDDATVAWLRPHGHPVGPGGPATRLTR